LSGPLDLDRLPDSRGRFGPYGGSYVPETLMAPLEELARAYEEAKRDGSFQAELSRALRHYGGRPTPLYFAERLTALWKGARVFLKREDLLHTGAHKLNNALGQGLLARRMGKTRLIAETGAGQHGVATATVGAKLGLETVVYMGEEDCRRQALNVYRMRLLGARVVPVTSGSRTLKDAVNEAMRDWVTNVEQSAYVLGSVLGPHPYPMMVRDFQSVIGRETRAQILEEAGRLPDLLVACVGGGSNAIGLFHPFLSDETVRMVGVEAGGRSPAPGDHAARFSGGSPGVLHGAYTWILQDEAGNILPTHSISAGLDYAAVGPEHAWLRETGRASYTFVSDEEAVEALRELARTEGILCALETAHAVAYAKKAAAEVGPSGLVVIGLSGRGDKDVPSLFERERDL